MKDCIKMLKTIDTFLATEIPWDAVLKDFPVG